LFYSDKDRISGEKHDDEFEVSLEACGRLFENGSGSVTFKVTLENDVNFRRIYETHSLNQRMFDKKETFSMLQLDNKKEELFKIFSRLVRELESEINKKEHLAELQDCEIMDLDATDIEAQNPYVLSVIELDDSRDWTQIFQKASPDTLECKELAAILFRLVYPADFFQDLRNRLAHVRIPSELLDDSNHIQNYAWDDHVLMWFSKTSSLFACSDKKRVPAVLIKNSFLDTLEIIRTRWHMSILINAQLDQDLEHFSAVASTDNLDVLDTLNKRRKRFASFLHDPLPYSFEGGSVSNIAKVAAEAMQLSELKNMTIEKFETLDKLHEDQMKIVRLRDFESYDRIFREKPKEWMLKEK
jgi:hypothetical protein